MNNPWKVCFSFIPSNDAKGVSARNCSQTTKEQGNTISQNKLNKTGFQGFLVVQFVNKRVKLIRLKQKLNHAQYKTEMYNLCNINQKNISK